MNQTWVIASLGVLALGGLALGAYVLQPPPKEEPAATITAAVVTDGEPSVETSPSVASQAASTESSTEEKHEEPPKAETSVQEALPSEESEEAQAGSDAEGTGVSVLQPIPDTSGQSDEADEAEESDQPATQVAAVQEDQPVEDTEAPVEDAKASEPEESTLAAVAPQDSAPAEPATPPTVSLPPPSFDIVRIERSGEAVIAGRAAPGHEVQVLLDGRVIGTVTADARGQWVFIPTVPFAPGSHQLSLRTQGPDGGFVESDNIVVAVVPERRQPATEEETTVAALPDSGSESASTEQETQEASERAAAPAEAGSAESASAQQEADEPAVAQETQEASGPTTLPAETESETERAETASAEQESEEPAAEQEAQAASELATLPIESEITAAAGEEREDELESETAQVDEPEPETPQETVHEPLVVLLPRAQDGTPKILQDPKETGVGDQELVLRSVDYDAKGRVTISGEAAPGTQVVVYLDNEAIGQGTVGDAGLWRFTPGRPVAAGLHRLRVDQLDGQGKVVARVETPFSRAAVLTKLPEESFVVVQPGNSLWRIARAVYGDGLRYTVIYSQNQRQIRDADLIYPGQIFLVPSSVN